MKKAKLFIVALIVSLLVTSQIAWVSAAPSLDEADFVSGIVERITVVTDSNTGESTVWIAFWVANGKKQTVHINQPDALLLELVYFEGEELKPNKAALNQEVSIPRIAILAEEGEMKHPVGSALAVFFEEIEGVDYEAIMEAHEMGHGFGVIAQALWLTQKIPGGDVEVAVEVLKAKESGDYSYFADYFDLENGSMPTNWGQFRKAVMAGDKKDNLGTVMSDKDKENQGNQGNHGNQGNPDKDGNNKDKDKDKGNNGNDGNPNKNKTKP